MARAEERGLKIPLEVMKAPLRFVLSMLLGCLTAVAVAMAATLIARITWPAYATAEPHKHYTLAMLLVRLAVGTLSVAFAACVTTVTAVDNGRAGWWLGVLFLVVSLPSHLYPGYVWKDYPAWYHLVYLAYLVPIAGFTAGLFSSLKSRAKNA
jgi:hypothetical protein